MTTTVAPHPADAPPRDGVAPHVTIGEETALVTYAFEHELVSELWMLQRDGWERVGTHSTPPAG